MSVAQNATPDDGSRYLCDLCNGNRFISLAGLTNHYYFFHHKTLSPEKVRRVFKKVPKQKSVYDPARRKKNKTIVDITDDSDHGSDDEFNNQNDEKRSNVPREPNRNENVQIVAVKKIAGQSVDNTVSIDYFTVHPFLCVNMFVYKHRIHPTCSTSRLVFFWNFYNRI